MSLWYQHQHIRAKASQVNFQSVHGVVEAWLTRKDMLKLLVTLTQEKMVSYREDTKRILHVGLTNTSSKTN